MLIIELKFVAGRFHATPWGRNVNEGVPEWPPSPYRLLRALYDNWKRKRSDWSGERVEPLFRAMASERPWYHLPPASASHTRSFLSENQLDTIKRQKVFDAFVAIDPTHRVFLRWSGATLSAAQQSDLHELLALINYFGRSESWVVAKVCTSDINVDWNCVPSDENAPVGSVDIIRVACPIGKESFNQQRGSLAARSTKKNTDPSEDWLTALAYSTFELFQNRLSDPPAMEQIAYLRQKDCFEIKPAVSQNRSDYQTDVVLFALDSKVLPLVTDTIEISERVRRKLMGIHRRIVGDPQLVSSKFSGKDANGRPAKGHRHCYILPMDQDRDGRLDHMLVACKEPFTAEEQLTLDRLESIWQPNGKPDVKCIPIQWGSYGELFEPTTQMVSVTPFVPPRYYRHGRGPWTEWLFEQLRLEAANHGLPLPSEIKLSYGLTTRQRKFRWIEFRRSRKGDPVRPGYGFVLEFTKPIVGPFALGYGAHFGLGQFVAAT
jgi:CRISPR-associated protein Csb2